MNRRKLRSSALAVALAVGAAGCASVSGDPAPSEPAAAPTSPAPPVQPNDAGDPGPAGNDGAVPVGYRHDRAGAAAAATSYLSALHQLVDLDASARRRALEVMAAPGAERVVEDTLEGLAAVDAQLARAHDLVPQSRTFIRDVPVAYELDPYTEARATVTIWSVGVVLLEGLTDATEVWSTNTVELVWVQGDWKVWAWSRDHGPTPAPATGDITPAATVLSAVEGWAGYRYVPGE